MDAFKSFRLIVGSGMLAQALLFGGTLVLSRCYGPAAFGELGYYLGVASVLAVVCGMRFDYLVFSAPLAERAVFFIVACRVALALHLALAIGLALLAWHGRPAHNPFWLLFFSAACCTFYLGTQLQVALGRFGEFARTRLIQAVALIALGAPLSLFGASGGLFIAYAAPQLLVGLLIFSGARRDLAGVGAAARAACWQTHRRGAAGNTVVVLMQYSTPFVPVLLGALYFPPDVIGAYFLFSSAFSAPFAVFRRSFVHYLNAEMSHPAHLRGIVQALAGKHWLLLAGAAAALLGCLLLALLAQPFTALVFGPSWVPFAALALPVLVFFLLDALLQPFTTLLPLWGAQGRLMVVEAARFVGVFVLVPAITVSAALGFFAAMLLYFGVMLAAYLANAWAIWRLVAAAAARPAAPAANAANAMAPEGRP